MVWLSTQVKVWIRENTYNDFYEIIEILQIRYFMQVLNSTIRHFYQIATSNLLLLFHMVYNCQKNKSTILIFVRQNSHILTQLISQSIYSACVVVNVIRGIDGLSSSVQVLESNEERKVMVDGARRWRWGRHRARYKWNMFYNWFIIS